MRKLLDIGNRYAKESTWKDFALVKFCLFAMGLAAGTLQESGGRSSSGGVCRDVCTADDEGVQDCVPWGEVRKTFRGVRKFFRGVRKILGIWHKLSILTSPWRCHRHKLSIHLGFTENRMGVKKVI